MAYLSGNVVRFDVSFTNTSTGAPVDPTTVTFSYQINSGSFNAPVTYTSATTPAVNVIAKMATGQYEVWVNTTGITGQLTGKWVSTGTGAASVLDTITVGGAAGSGLTFGDLIEKVYRRVMGGIRERTVQINQTGGIGSADTTVNLSGAQTTGITAGVMFAVDLEVLYVTGWNSSTSIATVVRGYLGSIPTAHANGAIVYINPRYSRYDIGVAVNDDLRSLSSPTNGLFRVGVAQLTYNPVFAGYDLGALPDNFIDVIEVRYRIAPPYRTFPAIKKWKVIRWQQNSTDPVFPSGKGLVLYESGWPGLPIYVTYTAPFIKLVAQTDSLINTPASNDEAPPYNGYSSVTVPNLTSTMVDLPPLGAEIDLTLPREISRNFIESQPDPRKALDVPAGSVSGSVNALIMRRAQRINEEADRLTRQYTRIRGW